MKENTMSNYLCQYLILEIFTRLPPKSLLRFRSLSKSLCRCISSPGFIRMHTSRSPQKILFTHENTDKNKERGIFDTLHGEDELALCLCPKRGYIGITTKLPRPRCKTYRIVGSCNGTLCFWTKKWHCNLILWNPSIRRKLNVPECPEKYDPWTQRIGFGFDPVSDDFKIVMISGTRDTSFVYAVKMGAWCEIVSVKPKFTSTGTCETYLLNGVLHWDVCYPIESQETKATVASYILTFDLSTHVFGMIPWPAPSWNRLAQGLTTFQGSLALISYGLMKNVDDNWIWVWRDASWSVGFKFNFRDQSFISKVLQLQGATNNGDLLLQIEARYLQVYNSMTSARSRVGDFDAASTLVDFRPFVETLHLIDMVETEEL